MLKPCLELPLIDIALSSLQYCKVTQQIIHEVTQKGIAVRVFEVTETFLTEAILNACKLRIVFVLLQLVFFY